MPATLTLLVIGLSLLAAGFVLARLTCRRSSGRPVPSLSVAHTAGRPLLGRLHRRRRGWHVIVVVTDPVRQARLRSAVVLLLDLHGPAAGAGTIVLQNLPPCAGEGQPPVTVDGDLDRGDWYVTVSLTNCRGQIVPDEVILGQLNQVVRGLVVAGRPADERERRMPQPPATDRRAPLLSTCPRPASLPSSPRAAPVMPVSPPPSAPICTSRSGGQPAPGSSRPGPPMTRTLEATGRPMLGDFPQSELPEADLPRTVSAAHTAPRTGWPPAGGHLPVPGLNQLAETGVAERVTPVAPPGRWTAAAHAAWPLTAPAGDLSGHRSQPYRPLAAELPDERSASVPPAPPASRRAEGVVDVPDAPPDPTARWREPADRQPAWLDVAGGPAAAP